MQKTLCNFRASPFTSYRWSFIQQVALKSTFLIFYAYALVIREILKNLPKYSGLGVEKFGAILTQLNYWDNTWAT